MDVYINCKFNILVEFTMSEGIDIYKKSKSKEYDICHFWYFLDKGFTYQPGVCNGCYDLILMFMNLSDLAFLNFNSGNYCCIINRTNNNEAINLLQNVDMTEKKEHYKT